MEKYEQWAQFIDDGKLKHKSEIEVLEKDERSDEAKFLKAGLNIYDVFNSLFETSRKQSKENEALMISMFENLSKKVPENWVKSLELAKAHDDTEKILIEEAKLNVAKACIDKFREIYVAGDK